MGKIYTGYFAGNGQWPDGAYPIGITRFPPKTWYGVNWSALAPSEELLRSYQNKQIDEYIFKLRYIKELEDKLLTPEAVRRELEKISDTVLGGGDIVLCCYEKPEDFCHRHILAEWLGDDITETRK